MHNMVLSIQNSKRKGSNKRKHVVANYRQEHCARIDDNPNIIHIDERRINTNLFLDEHNPPSLYELLRAWAEDDPERYNDYNKKIKLGNSCNGVVMSRPMSLKIKDSLSSVENNNDTVTSSAFVDCDPLTPEQIKKFQVSEIRIKDAISSCSMSPSELLRAHVKKFKDIKDKCIAASAMKNSGATDVINSLRNLE